MSIFQNTLHIIFGSRSGNSKAIALLAKEYAESLGVECLMESMDKFNFDTLKEVRNLLIIVSTHGEGEPPVPAEDFHEFIHGEKAPTMDKVAYAVLGLGDSSYRYFCQTGVDFDLRLEDLEAERIFPMEKCDIDFEEKSKKWVKTAVDHFAKILPQKKKFKNKQFVFELKLDDNQEFNAYKATVLQKTLLNGKNASHPTMNITLSLKDSGIQFHPGDVIGIYASNSRLLVDSLLRKLKFDPSYPVGNRGSLKMLKEALLNDYELTVITPVVLEKYADLTQNKQLKELLVSKEKVESYTLKNDVLDMVTDFPGSCTPKEFLKILRKLSPRLYSAASYEHKGQEEVDLTIRIIDYKHNSRTHQGVCSSFTWTRMDTGDKVPLFVERNARFRLPENKDIPVIMIATGTGVAPFRSFLQYRDCYNASGQNWLFFGERSSSTDFFYGDEFQNYQQKGLLTRLDTAFSRDSENKHYIYHKLLERGKDVYQWIQEGAQVYICGNKRTMANDVRKALSELVQINGNLTAEQSETFLKKLRSEKRLQEDVY